MTVATPPYEELIGEEVRVIVHRMPACRIEYGVKTSPAIVAKARKNAVKSVSKEITLPGFPQRARSRGDDPQKISNRHRKTDA